MKKGYLISRTFIAKLIQLQQWKILYIEGMVAAKKWQTQRHVKSLSTGFFAKGFYSLFTASDFTHSLSKLHEQHAEDMQALVEEFRRKNDELRAER